MQISPCNDRGFSLIEVMVAILVTVVAMFGLLSAVEVASVQNLQNQLRDEAIQVAEAEMNHWRAVPYGMISSCRTTPSNAACSETPARYRYAPRTVSGKLRGSGNPYTVSRSTIMTSDGGAVDLGVRVRWTFKNISTSHEVHTVRGS